MRLRGPAAPAVLGYAPTPRHQRAAAKEPPNVQRRPPVVPLAAVTLPLPLRNRLADLILDALHDADARRGLAALAAVCADPRAVAPGPPPPGFPAELFERRAEAWHVKSGFREHAPALGERAARAARALAGQPLFSADPPLEVILHEAAVLFDAGLYFEVHEVLEPCWMRAEGTDRESLQGLIQAAVGLQHLANGNVAGARALLREGAAKLGGRRLGGRDLDHFARALLRCAQEIPTEAAAGFAGTRAPRFPAEA